ncbi:DUF1330 domain-containing protein [Seohaeicola saemankumensis]|uniref:DUF1330 domain-containing protein n=1 Tax=Seohaeicola saemankumensis TaxID=481181 RepID=A0ABW3TEQ5_9RHOB
MTALLVVDETITNSAVFDDYKRAVVPTIEKFGGRFLARGPELEVLETSGRWEPDRLVIIEFPDMAALKAWYHSADYASVRELRFASATSTLVAMDTSPTGQKA